MLMISLYFYYYTSNLHVHPYSFAIWKCTCMMSQTTLYNYVYNQLAIECMYQCMVKTENSPWMLIWMFYMIHANSC